MPNLILVPCHAIYNIGPPELDESWYLAPFQIGEANEFCVHIKTACAMAKNDPSSVLIFSGGQTKQAAGQKSEAASYLEAALALNVLDIDTLTRVALEEYARDSLENLAFSYALYSEQYGSVPSNVTIVGWSFKEERFRLHAAALGFPAPNYVGCGRPVDEHAALEGEKKTLEAYKADPLGKSGDLTAKRHMRNPFSRVAPYKEEWCSSLNA